MTPEQLKNAAAVMLAAAEGKPIEFRSGVGGEWHFLRHSSPLALCWNWYEYEYRIAVTKPSINWEHVHPDYKWMATDQNGRTFLYKSEPYISRHLWVSEFHTPAASYASFIAGTCDWQDSLVVRPGVE